MAGRAAALLALSIAFTAIVTTSHLLAASPPWQNAKVNGGNSQELDLYTVVMMAAVLIGIAVVVFAVNAEQQRRRALQALAESRGLVFQLRAGAADKELLAGTTLWGKGHGGSASISSILEFPVTEELDLLVFEYSHSTGSGGADNTSSMLYYTVAWMDSPLLRLPKFSLRPASFLTIATKLGGFGGLNFPGHPNFSQAYEVRGRDEAAVRAILSSAIVQHCEAHPDLTIEGDDSCLIVARKQRLTAERFPGFLDEATELFRLFTVPSPH